MSKFKIVGDFDEDDQDFVYWSNDFGWVDFDSATTFDAEELYHIHMPIGFKAIAILSDINMVSLETAMERFKPKTA